jgi:hypothetical protein
MRLNLVGPFIVNAPFGTEIAFAKGLRQLGHAVVEVDPNVDGEMRGLETYADATVVFKSCVGSEKYLHSLRGPVVVYQPDDARFSHIREMMLMMRQHSDLFLSFDEYGSEVAKTMGYRASETLLLTADPDLYCPSPEPIERDIDVCFIGSMGDPVAHSSRNKMCQIVKAEADRCGWKFLYGQTRNEDIAKVVDAYRRSKVVINHATDVGQPFGYGYGLQCRHFEVGMTKTAFLTNTVYDRDRVREYGEWNSFDSEDDLLKQLHLMLPQQNLLEEMAQRGYDCIMKKHLPKHRAAELVDFIERNR